MRDADLLAEFRQVMQQCGLSYDDLARLTGLTVREVCNILRGESVLMAREMFLLADALGLDIVLTLEPGVPK